MRLKKGIGWLFTFLILFFFINIAQSYSDQKLEQYLEIELKRLEETYNLLETFAEEIWPGWNNYMDVEFQVQFPNLLFLIVNPRKEVPEGYELVPGRTVRGKDIYLNRQDELPIELKPPLGGGGGGGMTIRIRLREFKMPSGAIKKAEEAEAQSPQVQSESQILVYVHEYFHGFQSQVRPPIKKTFSILEKAEKTREERVKKVSKKDVEKEKKKKKRGKGWRPPKFKVNTEYATYKEIEGKALLGAYEEKDDAKALEYLKDYIMARELKLTHMPPEFAKNEVRTGVSEGTATYSNTKMALLVTKENYKPAMNQKDDPYFFDYKYMDHYIKRMTVRIKYIMGNTLDTLGHCYSYGMIQCFLLDRFVTGWKKGFFENERSQDDVIRDFLKLSDEEKKQIRERFNKKYGFDELRAKHGAVIKERDDAIILIESRKGKKYIVDFKKTKEFFNSKHRGKMIRLGVRQIFLNGIEELTLGDVILTSKDTPMERPYLWTVEWVDTEAKEGEEGYQLEYGEKVDDVYKNVTFTTKGFTLKAPEVKIKKKENEVKIIILSKVAR